MRFAEWLKLNEVKNPPHMAINFINSSFIALKELERSLRGNLNLVKKAMKIEREMSGSDYIRDAFDSIPRQIEFKNKGHFKNDEVYSKTLEDVIKRLDSSNSFQNTKENIKYVLRFNNFYDNKHMKDQSGLDYLKKNINRLFKQGYEEGDHIDYIIDLIKGSPRYFKGGEYEDEDIPFTQQQALEIINRTKKFFLDLLKYIRKIELFEDKMVTQLDLMDRAERKYYSGGGKDIKPEHKQIEVLYHATPYIREIMQSGLKVGETKALGGEVENSISFTSDFQIAKEIVRTFREAIAIAKGQIPPEKIIIKAKMDGINVEKSDPYKSYQYDKNPSNLKSYHDEIYHAWNLYTYYLALSKKRYNPAFFGVGPENFKHLDPKNVGIIAAKVDMTKIKTYLSSMEEYRAPPEAVLSFKSVPV